MQIGTEISPGGGALPRCEVQPMKAFNWTYCRTHKAVIIGDLTATECSWANDAERAAAVAAERRARGWT